MAINQKKKSWKKLIIINIRIKEREWKKRMYAGIQK